MQENIWQQNAKNIVFNVIRHDLTPWKEFITIK